MNQEILHNSVVIDPAAGNEPYILGVATALRVNELLEDQGVEPLNIIVPISGLEDVGPRQKRVLSEEFENAAGNRRILLDEESGKILDDTMKSQSNFASHLDALANKGEAVHHDLNQRLGKTATEHLKLRSLFGGTETEIDPTGIVSSIETGGRIGIDTHQRDFAFPVLTSSLVRATQQEGLQYKGEEYSQSQMDKVVREAIKNEEGMNKRFIPLVGTLSGQEISTEPASMDSKFQELVQQSTTTESGIIVPTPPMKEVLPPQNDLEDLQGEGVYAMLSGTDNGGAATYEAAKQAGMTVYTNPWSKEEGPVKISPLAMHSDSVKAIFARAGWGTLWQSLQSATPTLIPKYEEGDDPEMYFNHETLENLQISAIIDPTELTANGLRGHIARVRPRLQDLSKLTTEYFGTSDGIDYMAQKIVADYLRPDSPLRQKRTTTQAS